MQWLSFEGKVRKESQVIRWPFLALAYQFLPRVEGLFQEPFRR